MHELEIAKLDLNLLKVFIALAEEGSVTAAGDRLGLAQSTVSHSLSRLRDAFGDPLFVRSTHGMQPTPLAAGVVPAVVKALELIQDAVDDHRSFDPGRSRRTFVLLMTDVGEMLFIPPLIALLREVAPHVRIVVNQLPRDVYRDALESGRADLAIGQLPHGQTDLQQQFLSLEPFEGFARAGHPILENPSLEAFMEAHHLVIGRPAVSETHMQKALGPLAARRKIALELRHYLPAPFVLAQTDLIAVLPHTVSDFLTSFGTLARFPPPLEIEPVTMRQFWHARSTHDEGSRWLRSQIAALFQQRHQPR